MRIRARYLLRPDHTWSEDVLLTLHGGRVATIEKGAWTRDERVDRDYGNSAIVPGLVNAHSHAFQRSIRGKTEFLSPDHPQDDFWSWREAMYQAALTFDEDALYTASHLAFREMAATGITTVGEFHYIHHDPDGNPYDDRNALAHVVIQAARDAGLRIVLLLVAYNRGGFGRPAEKRQRRFIETDVDTYLKRVDDLRTAYARDAFVSVGVAPHSIRAVPADWLEAIASWAKAQDAPLHIHACEQRREIDECMAEYGKPPLEVFEDCGLFDARTTLVHATHLSDDELNVMARRTPFVCACPATERNLGDGFLPASALVERNVPISLGSDSHTTIDLFEEMRLVEYHERLRHERRNVLPAAARRAGHDVTHTAPILWPMATVNGARCLGIDDLGTLEGGSLADLCILDLDHISLAGSTRETLLSNITLSMRSGAIKQGPR